MGARATNMFGTTQATFASVVTALVGLLNLLVWLLSGTALVIFLYGLVLYISNGASQKGNTDGKKFIMWGLVALFVIFSLGGILRLMCTAFLGAIGSCGA